MPARIFLYVIAALIGLLLLAGITWSLFQKELMQAALVPSVKFAEQAPLTPKAYAAPNLWHARPDMGPKSPAEWLPSGQSPVADRKAALFYIHPTSYLDRSHWNAPLDDAGANEQARVRIRNQASAFTAAAQIWAPKYRQATFGSFLKPGKNSAHAVDLAYQDVAAAFQSFLALIPADQPIILVGHSQGAAHLLRLLQQEVANKPINKRVIAAYVIGWPISIAHDLPALGLPACVRPDQSHCIMSWQSFADPADPSDILSVYNRDKGLDGMARTGTAMLCTNPLTGGAAPVATADANLGALTTTAALEPAALTPKLISARCTDQGLLSIGQPPKGFDAFVLPGNNYHIFDINLFWANVRADSLKRTQAFLATSRPVKVGARH
ncbi:DUF3089 domain-containing protein [Aquisediminimonas sediminicola]|uniref:DUF3089 domain-containing protein n=1 Tax=Alteraquisediminimonas sediminicola TaxID=2676787 RepID=UPI001C8EECFA|nr:DUF3089 domain-containing protein [Aquisediminimonas sediminicola]